MPSLHLLIHAVSLVIIAYLMRKYTHVKLELVEAERFIQSRGERDACVKICAEYQRDHDGRSYPVRGETSGSDAGVVSPTERGIDNDQSFMRDSPVTENTSHKVWFDTSVWCIATGSNNLCGFKNLCYHRGKGDFVYFYGDGSKRENLDDRVTVDLATVRGHNAYTFTYVDLPVSAVGDFSVAWITDPSVIFSRFKPDNLMHALHDDVIPLIYTLSLLEQSRGDRFRTRVIFADDVESGYESLYTNLSYKSHRLNEINTERDLVCFRDVYVGLFTTTLWYDYGFVAPQEPISDSNVTAGLIHDAVEYLRRQINVGSPKPSGDYLVLFSRKETRRILNEVELVAAIVSDVGMKVRVIDEDAFSIPEIIAFVGDSRGVIGMHGALMSLAMFLTPGSVVVELYPYGVNPDNYTPYKTLSGLVGLAYVSWRNLNAENSVGHPENTREQGGIFHLPRDERESIQRASEVGAHICCDDASWLYHIYQDTVVDLPRVLALLKSALSTTHTASTRVPPTYIQPSPPRNVSCGANAGVLDIRWDVPWNVKYMRHTSLSYEVLVLDSQDDSSRAYVVDINACRVVVGETSRCTVWVRSLVDGEYGSFSDSVYCRPA